MANSPRIDRLEYNKIINGNFDIWQRGTSLAPITNGAINYLADRWFAYEDHSGSLNYERSTDVPNNKSNYSVKMTVNTTGSPTGTQVSVLEQRIEGSNFQSLLDKELTISFYVKSSITGTFCVTLRNWTTGTRSYVSEYTINAANTWEKKTITLTHDSSSTWNTDTSVGARLTFTLSAGASLETTSGAWQVGDFVSTTNQADFTSNAAATWQIAQVMINEGKVAGVFDKAGKDISEEIAMCQRYYQKNPRIWCRGHSSTTQWYVIWQYETVLRAAPTVSLLTTSPYSESAPTEIANSGSGSALAEHHNTVLAWGGRISGFTGLTSGLMGFFETNQLEADAEL